MFEWHSLFFLPNLSTLIISWNHWYCCFSIAKLRWLHCSLQRSRTWGPMMQSCLDHVRKNDDGHMDMESVHQCNASKLPTFRQVRKLFAPRGVSCCMLPESGHGLLLEALVISHDALWWCSSTTLRTRLFLLGKHVGPLGPLWLSN